MRKDCSTGCGNFAVARGLCDACYSKARRFGVINRTTMKAIGATCKCGSTVVLAKGMCNSCYLKDWRKKND